MGEAKGGRHCAPIGRKAIRAEFLRHFIAAQASNENRSRPAGFESWRRGRKKPATGKVTGFSIQMVPPTGFEPVISTLKGWRPWPLDDGDSAVEYTRYLVCEKPIFHVNSQC